MRAELLQIAADLARKGEPFALAFVVRREPASSAQVGNMAVVTESGQFHGWLGGSCIQPTVMREAAAALQQDAPRLLSLSPDPGAEHRPGVTVFPMTCHSGGTVEIYLEPVMPAPRLLVFGVSPTAAALVRLGKAMGYTVDAVDPEADGGRLPEAHRIITRFAPDQFLARPASQRHRLFAVVATLGERDEDAAMEALSVEPAYLGVVASRRRFAQISETLAGRGVSRAALEAIRNPAGIDIDAKAPEEVALSILAEIVQVKRAGRSSARTRPVEAPAAEERDPVCGMTVEVATARHKAEHDGRTYYFCCGGCRQRFLAAPERFVDAVRS
jgi:xanthine dehydrogenase accessory factor